MGSYSESLQFLYGLQKRGIKFGLQNISQLLAHVGNPERSFPSIHVAGTNGKGSTASFIASILTESGRKTGLYTSPHLVRFNERIRVGKEEISDVELVSFTTLIHDEVQKLNATFFEATTCIAFMHFAKHKVEIAVVETGLGGRLDATNVLIPLVSVITNISREHTDYLGSSLEEIALEKAGIIKAGAPVVTSEPTENILDILSTKAKKMGSEFWKAQELADLEHGWNDVEVRLGLSGMHQKRNAELAVASVALLQKQNYNISPSAIGRGLANVCKNTGIRGRLEQVGNCILDVAHNPAGTRALVTELKEKGLNGLTVVFGVMKDKDYSQMIVSLSEIAQSFICVQPSVERALNAEELNQMVRSLGFASEQAGSIEDGLRFVVDQAPEKKVLVTGSFYVVGEALEFLQKSGF